MQTCLQFVRAFLNNQVINIKSVTTYYSNMKPTFLNIMFVLQQDIVIYEQSWLPLTHWKPTGLRKAIG